MKLAFLSTMLVIAVVIASPHGSTVLAASATHTVSVPSVSDTLELDEQRAENDRQLEDAKFRHEIGQSILEKLVIAGLIALLALWTGQVLERFKTREAYIGAFAQTHVKCVSEIWEQIYEWEARIDEAATRVIDEAGLTAAADKAVLQSRDLATELRSMVEKQRFWLGQALYARFVDYHNILHPYLDALVLQDAERAREAKKFLNECKQDIMEVLNADLT